MDFSCATTFIASVAVWGLIFGGIGFAAGQEIGGIIGLILALGAALRGAANASVYR